MPDKERTLQQRSLFMHLHCQICFLKAEGIHSTKTVCVFALKKSLTPVFVLRERMVVLNTADIQPLNVYN